MDFARRRAIANAHLNEPNQAPAIMLIDEIDLHLHPIWQHRIISDLLRTFPKTQFIITTHSPYIISSINNLLEAGECYDGITKGRIPKERGIELEKVVPRDVALTLNDVNAVSLFGGTGRAIIDKETGLIVTSEIDG
jgi:hypothetical protein